MDFASGLRSGISQIAVKVGLEFTHLEAGKELGFTAVHPSSGSQAWIVGAVRSGHSSTGCLISPSFSSCRWKSQYMSVRIMAVRSKTAEKRYIPWTPPTLGFSASMVRTSISLGLKVISRTAFTE